MAVSGLDGFTTKGLFQNFRDTCHAYVSTLLHLGSEQLALMVRTPAIMLACEHHGAIDKRIKH